jgi:hypothetical protein
MLHIKKIKTWYGVRYAVVEPFTSYTTTADKKTVKVVADYPVEYKTANGLAVAVFPLTAEGLAKAKEVRNLFKKS